MLIFPDGQNLQIYVIKKANFKNGQGLVALAVWVLSGGQLQDRQPYPPEGVG